MHYYQFNIGDYKSHTSHLEPLEDLAYRRMMDYCYLNEIGLPESVEEIARLISMRTHCDCIANVLREFFHFENGCYYNKRIEAEISAYHEKSEKAAKSAKARWAKNKKKTDANALRTVCENDANAMLNTKQETLNTKQDIIASSQDDSQLAGTLPTNKKGEEFPVYQKDIELWTDTYPKVDVIQQLKKIRAWLDANPTKRKTSKGMKKFINNWLSREQDR